MADLDLLFTDAARLRLLHGTLEQAQRWLREKA